MNKRREFLKGAGLIGGLAGLLVGAKVVINEKERNNRETIKEIESIAPQVLELNTKYGEIDNTVQSPYAIGGYTGTRFKPGTERTMKVKFLPGPDGELYIQTNGTWKKVITAS